jgi:hypothetical protein
MSASPQISYRLANLLDRAELYPGAQMPGAEPLFPISSDELHRRLHGHVLTYDEREEIKRGLKNLGLMQD